jgi:hypothetical protein
MRGFVSCADSAVLDGDSRFVFNSSREGSFQRCIAVRDFSMPWDFYCVLPNLLESLHRGLFRSSNCARKYSVLACTNPA